MKQSTNNRTLELEALKKVLLETCTFLNRPIRKNQLIRMVHETFECNTPSQIEFALLNLLEENQLSKVDYFIMSNEVASLWDGVYTSADESIIKFLISSCKEEAKHDLYFHVFALEKLYPKIFFKYIEATYPTLLDRDNTSLTFMKQMENSFPFGLSNDFHVEMNDYPYTNGWLTRFFDNHDCRIFIKGMNYHGNHVQMDVVLLPSKKGGYKQANIDYNEFEQNIPRYFEKDIVVHVKKSLTTIATKHKKK